MVKTYKYLGTEFCIPVSHGPLVFTMKESSRKHLHSCHFVISHSTKMLIKKHCIFFKDNFKILKEVVLFATLLEKDRAYHNYSHR